MGQPVRWGIVGLGNIAAKFAGDLSLVPDAELHAVASRDRAKSRSFAQRYDAKKAYDDYMDLFEDPGVDVVYIASPHSFHKSHTLAAIGAGKHVLCEKPLGINAAEVREMCDAASEKGCFLMEALWSRFNPCIHEVWEMVRKGRLGPVSILRADFAFPALDRDPSGRLLNPGLAGGSLLDIGIYPVFLAYLILGVPERIRVAARFHTTGVEKQIGMLFDYPDGLAVLYSGLTSHSEMRAELGCRDGTIYLNPRWHETASYTVQMGDTTREVKRTPEGAGYVHEITEVHQCLAEGMLQSRLWSWSDSQALHDLLDRIREQAGIDFPGES